MQRVQRFLSKFAMDVLRTAVASAIGALLYTHSWMQGSSPAIVQSATPAVATEQVAQMIRDEHDVMVEYLKAEHAKELAVIEQEVRETKAARSAQDTTVRQAELEPRKVSAPRPNPTPRVSAVESVNIAPSPSIGAASPTAGPVTVAGTVVAAGLPPAAAMPQPPEEAQPAKVEPPREATLAEKAAAATHVNDVVSFARDVSGWFKHEDAPVPPAEVRLSPFANAGM
jgi:hypothetical protein